jgi:predicted permease
MARFTPTSPISFSAQLKSTAGDNISIPSVMAYPNYFATMGMPIVAGRDFSPGDLEESGPFVMVVNQTFARQVFKGEDPVGKRISTRLTGRSLEIIGVVKDSRYANLRGETPPVMYQPFLQTQTGRGQMVLYVRAAGNSGLILPRVREEVQKIDGSLPLFEIRTLAEEMNAALIRERLIASLSGFFGILAMLLASVGLYGLLAFAVVQRTGEIGIRMALGARPGAVMWMVTREALLLVLIGVLVGIPAALAMAHLASNQISGLLFGLSPTDPLTIAAATALLVWVAIVAGYLPARRASRVDPIMALRNE